MKKIRLLPLVLIAVSALLAVKVLGFIMGVEPFEVGPRSAVASGGEAPAGHGEAAAEPSAAPDTSAVDRLTAPIDLADEYKKLKAEQEKGGGHGEAPAAGHGEAPAAGHGEAPPAAGHDAAPADGAAHGDAPAADAGHGAPADAKPADAGKEAAPAAGTEAAPAAAGHEAAPATDAGHGAPAGAEAAPAAAGHGAPAEGGHGAPAEGGHGAKAPTGVYTERPKEYSPPIGSSERAILEGLAARRDDLDKRAHDLDLRAKLLEATEQRLNERLNQLQSIESQLGVAGGGGAPAANPGASGPAASAPSTPAAAGGAPAPAPGAAGAAPAMNEQLAALVALYEGMKPKAAAAVFDKLDNGTLLELAGHMNPRKLSPILAAMDPDKASRITSLMVGAQQAQKRVVVQVEQVAPTLGPTPGDGTPAPADASQLPQIMPAP